MIRVLRCAIYILSLTAAAQSSLIPSPYLDTIPADIHKALKENLKAQIAGLKVESAQEKYLVVQLLRTQFDETVSAFNRDELMAQSEVTDYLRSVLTRVMKANDLTDQVNIYAQRSHIPNAVCYGPTTISVMLGLLSRLDTEDQVAFVVCHELAHAVSNHNLRSIQRRIRAYISESEALLKAKRSKYGSVTKTQSIRQRIEISQLRHSREFEFEADSLAMLYYLKAGFDPGSAIRSMEILDSADVDAWPTFDLQGYWKRNGVTTTTIAAPRYTIAALHSTAGRPDSLTTHPDCKRRITALHRQFASLGISESSPGNTLPNSYLLQSRVNMVDGAFTQKAYGWALYNSMALTVKPDAPPYFASMVGKTLFEIYSRQASHTLNAALDSPDPRLPDSYNRLVAMIHGLRLSELENMTHQFMAGQPEGFLRDQHFMYALWITSHLKSSGLSPDTIKADYLAFFPDGIYIDKLVEPKPKKR